MFLPDMDNAQNQQWQIDDEDTHHGRSQIIQEFHRFTRIGGYEIQKHIHRYHSRTEEIEQHQLEGCEKDEDERPPYHFSRTSGNGKEPHIQCQRQQHVGTTNPRSQTLGKAQSYIRQQQCHHRIPIKKGTRRHLIIYRITYSFTYRIIHSLHLIIYIEREHIMKAS